jgi:hypothetical protein
MKRIFRAVYILIFSISISTAVHSQSNGSSRASEVPAEKIYLHSPADFYVTGDLLWFKVYAMNRFNNQPGQLSALAYVEVLTTENKPVLQATIELKAGTGNGSFILPQNLSTGSYILRAYTKHIESFGPEYFHHSWITIVNPLKPATVQKNKERAPLQINFFPEGGTLVEGLENNIGYRLMLNGHALPSRVTIVDSRNQEQAALNFNEDGYGSFVLKPERGVTYFARVTGTDSAVQYPLPAAVSSGTALRVTGTGGTINVTASTTKQGINSFTVVVRESGEPILQRSMMISNGAGSVSFPADSLKAGANTITLTDNLNQPAAKRYVFRTPSTAEKLQVSTDNSRYGKRQKISVSLRTEGSFPSRHNLSLAVVRVDSLNEIPFGKITRDILLRSELNRAVTSDVDLSSPTRDIEQQLDLVLLSHEVNNSKNASNPNPVAETEGHLIRTKIVNRKTGEPGTGVPVYLSVPGTMYQFSTAITDDDGAAEFVVKKFHGAEEVLIQTNHKNDSIYRIDVESPYSGRYLMLTPPSFVPDPALTEKLIERSIAAQVAHAYHREKLNSFTAINVSDTTAFYGAPDRRYMLDDYTRFPTMEEVMREYVPEVKLLKKQQEFSYEVRNAPYQTFFSNEPLVLLDGVPVFDITKIVQYDPLKVRKMEIMTRKYYIGKVAANGIVSYATYEGNLDGFTLDPSVLVYEYKGIQLERTFYSPEYNNEEEKNSRVPDFRNLLYWNPSVNLDASGSTAKLFTSDIPGRYAVIAEGLSSSGQPVSAVTYFDVE